MNVRVVADRAGKHPADKHIREVDGAGEFADQAWPAMRHRVAFENPGSASTSSPALRILIDVHNSGDSSVAEMPLSRPFRLALAKYRSIVAAGMANNSAFTLDM